MSTFTATDLCVSYGPVKAVEHMDLTLENGRITGLIGPNGAGKTTLIDALCGFTSASGSVRLGDRDVSRLRPEQRARLGIVRTFQSLELFDDMSVRDNLRVAAARPPWWALARDVLGLPGRDRDDRRIDRAMELLDLSDLTDVRPSDVSLGERKRIAVARALSFGPEVLMLDEPAAGLDSTESLELGRHLRQVADTGIAVLLVDHDMGLVLSSCEDIYVLSAGRPLSYGTPDEIRMDQRVVEAYLGTSASGHAVANRGVS